MPKQSGLKKYFTQIGTEDWLGRLIDTFHNKEGLEKWVVADPTIHPSSSGSNCPREIELGMLGYRTPTPAKNRRRMDNGTATHDRWEKYLKNMGVLHACEVNVKDTDPFFNGTCDLILQRPQDGALVIGEIKTMNEARWKKVPEQNPDKKLMMRELLATEKPYVYQLTEYIVMMKKLYNTLDEGFFLFENTNTQEIKIRYVEPDEKLKEDAFRNPVIAQKAFLDGYLLDPPFPRTSQTCKMCWKKDACFKLQDKDPEMLDNLMKAFEAQ